MEAEIVKMSGKGQLVVPQSIREELNFKASDMFVPFAVKDGVLFRRIDLKKEYDALAKDVQKQFKQKGIKRKDVDGAVRWARRGS